jgi:hypothetical protein
VSFTVKNLTKENFQTALNDKFVLRAGSTESLDLELVAVNDLTAHLYPGKDPVRAPFSLHFRGPATPWAQQHMYQLENEKVGSLELFLVPVGPDGKGMLYEAIFT